MDWVYLIQARLKYVLHRWLLIDDLIILILLHDGQVGANSA